MNSLIKDRLDKIEKGIVPEGYKKTKIGIIPEDWEVKKLEKISERVNVGFVGTCERYYVNKNEGIPMIRTGNIQDKEIDLSGLKYVSEEFHEKNKKSHINKNDLLLARHGSNGQTAIYKYDYTSNCLNIIIITSDNEKTIPLYLYYQMNSQSINSSIMRKVGGSTQKVVNLGDIKLLDIPLPSLQEQEEIANILSTWDNAIENIEKLIKEKEIQKKGLMQQLLTGETRLPGFNGEWEEVKLGDVSDIYRGASPRPISDQKWFDEDSNIGWVRISDVTKSDKYLYETDQYLSKEGIKKSRFVEKDNIIMSICATVGKPIITKLDVCIHDGFVIYQNPSLNKMFLYYYLEHIESKWIRYGQIGSQMNLNINIVSNEIIKVPKQLEQKAIAEILSTADKEIELLNKLLQAKKEEKKGLMQLLLTGIVRV